MVIIEYCREGMAISDFDYQEFISDALKNEARFPKYKHHYKVSTSILIEAIRAEIAEGHIGCKEVRIIFNNKIVPVNKYGAIPYWPDGFCDANFLLTGRISHAAMTKYKEEKR